MTTSLPVVAYTTTQMDDKTAYELTKTYWEQKKKMGAGAAWWDGVNEGLMANITSKIHTGAAIFYDEIGVSLTDAQR